LEISSHQLPVSPLLGPRERAIDLIPAPAPLPLPVMVPTHEVPMPIIMMRTRISCMLPPHPHERPYLCTVDSSTVDLGVNRFFLSGHAWVAPPDVLRQQECFVLRNPNMSVVPLGQGAMLRSSERQAT